jgi:hypothetical protein
MTRLLHAQGDLLRARDLEADVGAERHARERHVIGVHATWGVGIGLEVTLAAGGGSVLVGPGFAYDPGGREIASPRTHRVAAPRSGADARLTLVVAAPSACGGPVFGWRRTAEPVGEAVPLARVRMLKLQLTSVDTSVRLAARLHAGGRVAGGIHAAVLKPRQALTTFTVSTAAGGFARTPFYVATVADDETGALAAVGARWRQIHGSLLALRNETATQFVVEARLAARTATTLSQLPAQLPLRLAWLGVEPRERCGVAAGKEPR